MRSRTRAPATSARRRSAGPRALGAALVMLLGGCQSQGENVPGESEIGLAPTGERWEVAAERWTEEFEAGGPEAPHACALATRALLVLRQREEARELVDRGLELHPDDPELLELRGNVLETLGFRRAAESCYDRALELDPERETTLFARARLRLELGLATAARRDLERCLQAGQNEGEVWLLYGRALAATRETRRAFDSFARAFDLGQQDQACLVAAARLYVDEDLEPRSVRDRELATAWLQRAIALDARDAQALFLLAAIHEERGEAQAAVATLERALAADPGHLPSLARLAQLYCERGEREQAAELARRALELEQHPERRRQLEALLMESSAAEAAAPASR